MTEDDAMRLLAAANPVRETDLSPLPAPARLSGPVPHRRLGVALALVAVIAAALAGIFAPHTFRGAAPKAGGTGLTGASGATGNAGPSGPEGTTGAKGPTGRLGPISLAEAPAVLGGPLVLPDLPLLRPSDAGIVTEDCPDPSNTRCLVNVDFPAKALFINYQPGESADPVAKYNAMRVGTTDRVEYLSGVPAFVSGTNYLQFQLNGVTITVNLGFHDKPPQPARPTVQAIAQSIIDRSK